MSASAREVESRKIAAAIAAVRAYIESEARPGGDDGGSVGAWRREMLMHGESGDAFGARHRSWTGRN